jgi:hypothetical protein
MASGLTFRKDCDSCGKSFLSPDRKAKLCPRCAREARHNTQKEPLPLKKPPQKAAVKKEKILVKGPSSEPPPDSIIQNSKEIATKEISEEGVKAKEQKKPDRKQTAGKATAAQKDDKVEEEIKLTEAQEQEIIGRYQDYVQEMQRPPGGRRKTIARDMGIPLQAVIQTLRKWSQGDLFLQRLIRENRFLIEKSYFQYLEEETSFSALKKRIAQETGLDLWEVARYLDLLHDGEDKLRNVPDVSGEQETAILSEYQKYLSGTAPPSAFLHPLIAERTGVTPKQVYKVLLAYRLKRFRERWG